MSKLLKIFIFAACLICVLISKSIASGKQTIYYQNYHFVFDRKDSLFVEKLVLKVKDQLVKIEDFFNYKPQSIITIIITRSDSEYDFYKGNNIPEWSQAVALTKENIIILKIATSEDVKKSPEILMHELVHIFFADRIKNQNLPVWIHEGIAQYLSGYELTIDDRIHLANALSTNKLISLSAMDTLFSFNQSKARLAYIEALAAIQFIVKVHGTAGLKQLIGKLDQKIPVNRAFEDALGYDFIDFEIYWYKELRSQNRWLILLNFENILWISILLLLIFVLVLIKIKNRKLEKSWEDETKLLE